MDGRMKGWMDGWTDEGMDGFQCECEAKTFFFSHLYLFSCILSDHEHLFTVING